METFDEIYDRVKDILDDDINMKNLTSVVLKVMQITDKIPTDGPTKKKAAMHIITRMILESKMENKEIFLEMVNIIVPPMIDCLVDVDKRKIVIKVVEKSKGCMKFLCS